jgi:hypothetical protein
MLATVSAVARRLAEFPGAAKRFDVDVLTRVAHRDQGCAEEFHVQGGVTYRVVIDGFARNRDYGTGPISLTLGLGGGVADPEPAPTAPA